jgi:hypothetical protein
MKVTIMSVRFLSHWWRHKLWKKRQQRTKKNGGAIEWTQRHHRRCCLRNILCAHRCKEGFFLMPAKLVIISNQDFVYCNESVTAWIRTWKQNFFESKHCQIIMEVSGREEVKSCNSTICTLVWTRNFKCIRSVLYPILLFLVIFEVF